MLESSCTTSDCDDDLSWIDPIVLDILSFTSQFSLCSFSLVRRFGNKVAHSLARHASVREECPTVAPRHIGDLILVDLPT